jgi:TonB family protein
MMAGNALSQPAPVYPSEAKAAGIQGVVVLHAIISKTGDVRDLSVVSGPPALMVPSIDAVRQWKYKPYLLNGEPVEVETTININYSLAAPNPGVSAEPKPEGTSGSSAGSSIRISAGVAAAMLMTKVNPVYPAEAKAAHIEGVVTLRVVISKTGAVDEVQIVSGPEELIQSATAAVFQWKYKPFLLNGQPVDVATTINVNYSLQGSAEQNLPSARKMPDGATAPMVIYMAQPQFTEEARKAKFMGVVLVNLTVDEKGLPQNVHVLRGVGMGLDQKAVDAVKQYRFKPAMKEGKPVEEALNVEVNFQVF